MFWNCTPEHIAFNEGVTFSFDSVWVLGHQVMVSLFTYLVHMPFGGKGDYT